MFLATSETLKRKAGLQKKKSNVYLVVVVEVSNDEVVGHRLLDLNKEYGLAG